MFFPENVVMFLNSASSVAALAFYLSFSDPSMKSGVHNGSSNNTSAATELAELRKITTFSGKNTIFYEHPV